MPTEPKILALQFKYFGDAVLMTPSLRAIREKFPQSELHVLVPEKIAPVLQQLAVDQPRLAHAAPARQRDLEPDLAGHPRAAPRTI